MSVFAIETVDDTEYPDGFRLFTTLAALILAIFLATLDTTILATAIPRITDQFHSLTDVGWYASAFFMTVSFSQSAWGKIYKYFDLKTMFLIAITIFEIRSLICGAAPNSQILIFGRAVAGLGGAGVLAGCYIIIAFSVPPAKRPAYTGIMSGTSGAASVVGLLLGGIITDRLGWRWCFYINLPIGGLSAAIILFTFRTPSHSRNVANTSWSEKIKQMDIIGMMGIMAAVTCYLLAFQWGGITKSWKSADVIGLLVGFFLLTIDSVGVEYVQGDRALFVPRIVKQRAVYVGCIYGFLIAGGYFVLVYYLPIYFQSMLGVSAEQSGVRNLAFVVAVTICTIASGASISACGYFAPFAIVGAGIMTIGTGLIYTFNINSSSAAWIGFQVLTGIGAGICLQTPMVGGKVFSAPEDLSSTTAILLFAQTMGGTFIVSAAESGLTNTLIRNMEKNVPSIRSATILAVGASKLREVFTAEELVGILDSYMAGLKVAFAVAIALAGGAAVAGLFMPWGKAC
ncbi:major facilitator superfamily domain-containing protein [Leptodontidium sp. MPI-SDFR-AT-0119]|nr:major facilitator superfamily domain-containing protein [Leptodontidium sp. MPI-SDFR-AT-0119]